MHLHSFVVKYYRTHLPRPIYLRSRYIDKQMLHNLWLRFVICTHFVVTIKKMNAKKVFHFHVSYSDICCTPVFHKV